MCQVGKPIEIIDVEPLALPAPLRKETEQPTEQPVIVEIPVSETISEGVTAQQRPRCPSVAGAERNWRLKMNRRVG
jgi:hypothetical protein